MIELIIIFIIGLSLGSFANVCIYRLPLNMNLITPSSFCQHCKSKIKYVHNIPIISYLFLKGKSSCCHKKIPLHYPLVELFIGLISVFFFIEGGFTFTTFFTLVFFIGLVILFITDLQHYIIPNAITYSLSVLGIIISYVKYPLLQHPLLVSLTDSLIGGIASGLLLYSISKLYFLIRKKEGMGMGDVKMITMIGFWMGIKSTIIIIILSSLLGTLIGLILILLKKIDRDYLIPYGTLLSLTTIFLWIYYIFSFYHW